MPSPPIKDEVIQRLSKHVQTRTTKGAKHVTILLY